MLEGLPAHFDAEWYLREYADVRASGMDPYEHYLWLGRRLNRLPAPQHADNSNSQQQHKAAISQPISHQAKTYDENSVDDALSRLCNWLVPQGDGATEGLTASAIFEAVRCDFGSVVIEGVAHGNPNARKLVDFMSSHDGNPDITARLSLPHHAGGIRSILLGSYYAPTLAHAGGLRLLDTYALIRRKAPHIHLTLFAPCQNEVDGNYSQLRDIFDEVHICRPEQFRSDWLMQQLRPGQRYDLADLQFHQAGHMARDFRAIARRIIFTPMETLSRFAFDQVRDAAKSGELDRSRLFATIHDGAMEREIMASVDMTVCVSDADAEFLAHVTAAHQVNYFPTGLSTIEFKRELASDYIPPPFPEKFNRLVFAAYFGSETNRLGLQWYIEKVHPRVLANVPDYDLAVVGRGDTAALEALGAPSVCFIGEGRTGSCNQRERISWQDQPICPMWLASHFHDIGRNRP